MSLTLPTILSLVSGCSGQDKSSEPSVTYAKDVRPLLSEYCSACHQPGNIGPFPLGSYADAKKWGAAIVSSVKDRRMPPYLADASGACGTFREPRWLSEEQIRVFEQWLAEGMPEGDPNLAQPSPRPLPKLEGELRSVDIGFDYLPDQTKTDDYRCFVIDSPGDIRVTGYNVIPGNPRIVHHLIAYQVSDVENADAARQLDEQSDGPGYDCLGTGPQVDAVSVAGWAPGGGAELFPKGTGLELHSDRPLVMEVHYNIAGGPGETDRTQLQFKVAGNEALRPAFEVAALDYNFTAPAGLERYETVADLPLSWQLPAGTTGEIQLLSANGHMHQRGVAQRVERVTPSGEVECLMDIPRWDFDWQLTYWYDKPITVSAEDSLRITCAFDTQTATGPVTWGDGTSDEMCLASFFAVMK